MANVLFRDRAALPQRQRYKLARLFGGHQTLEIAVRWGLAQPDPRLVTRVIKQDEYTQDVVLPIQEALFVVYDST